MSDLTQKGLPAEGTPKLKWVKTYQKGQICD